MLAISTHQRAESFAAPAISRCNDLREPEIVGDGGGALVGGVGEGRPARRRGRRANGSRKTKSR
jgi:hypothetical protein